MTGAAFRRLVPGLVPVLAFGTLAACEPAPSPVGPGAETPPAQSPDPGPQPGQGTCGAGSLSALRGRDIESLDAASLPPNRRVLLTTGPAPALTDPARLTIRVEPGGRVVQLLCG